MISDAPFPVTVHPYESPTYDACAYELGASSTPRNAIIFIGGLGDGPHTVPYIRTVSKYLDTIGKHLGYSIFEVRLRSSFIGYGTSSLKKDVDDIAALVKYLRGLGKDKIILFGHSTGCQDCIEYADYSSHGIPPVDGFIMQGPISDREAVSELFPAHQEILELANQWIADGKDHDCLPHGMMPQDFEAPMTAYRFKSLFAKHGDDDYFSSDLDDETVCKYWGRFEKPVLVLHSANDEFVPAFVNQASENLRLQKANAMVSPLSGLIPEASHQVREQSARQWLGQRVVEFLQTLERGGEEGRE